MGTWNVEVTDTFADEANYSWARRYSFDAADDASDLAIMRRAKLAAGFNGVRGRTDNFGDMIEFRPAGMCIVMFVTWRG